MIEIKKSYVLVFAILGALVVSGCNTYPPPTSTTTSTIATTTSTPTTVPTTTTLPLIGNLSVSSSPTNASVFLDGVLRGNTPIHLPNINAGIHSLNVTKSGYMDFTKLVNVSAGKLTQVSLNLTPA